MRIIYDHQVFSLQDHGGISVYFYELAARLGQVPDLSVDVCLGIGQSVYPFSSLDRPSVQVLEWRTKWLKPGLVRYAANEILTGSWALLAGKWDIYHSTYYRRMPAIRARRIVATNHDCTQERFPELFDDGGRVFRAKRQLYSQADAIICVSESSRRDLLEFYNVDWAKTHVIYQGVPRLSRAPERCREFIESIRRPYLLFVGSRPPYKNFHGLIHAYGTGGFAKDYDLVVLGGGQFSEAESAEIGRLQIAEQVLHWSFVSEPVLAEAYSRAKLFVSPSIYEGFGLLPLEALSLGCPVLASNSASIPEICGNSVSYFDPQIPGDLERGLRDALNDPDLRRRLAAGSERVKRYDWQTNAEETLALYRTL